MQVGIYYPSKVEYFVPPSGPEKQLIKGVTTAAYTKVAKGVLKHNRILQHVMKAISNGTFGTVATFTCSTIRTVFSPEF